MIGSRGHYDSVRIAPEMFLRLVDLLDAEEVIDIRVYFLADPMVQHLTLPWRSRRRDTVSNVIRGGGLGHDGAVPWSQPSTF